MIELLIQFLMDLAKPLFLIDSLEERSKQKYFKHITRFIIDMSSLSDNLNLFCQALEQWKKDIKSYRMGFTIRDEVPRLNTTPINNINRNIKSIEEDRFALRKWLKVASFPETFFIISGTDFEIILWQYIQYKSCIFGLWDLLLSNNAHRCCKLEKTHIAIPSYSFLLTDMSIMDLAIGAHELSPAVKAKPSIEGKINEKALFFKDYGYFFGRYGDYKNNPELNALFNRQIECIKYISIDEADEEIDSVIRATLSAKSELDEMLSVLKIKLESLLGENKSDLFLYL